MNLLSFVIAKVHTDAEWPSNENSKVFLAKLQILNELSPPPDTMCLLSKVNAKHFTHLVWPCNTASMFLVNQFQILTVLS